MLSRIAESLYWIGRYTERAEGTARLLDVSTMAALEGSGDTSDLLSWVVGAPGELTAREITERYALDRGSPMSIASSVRAARENARTVREAVTTEMWEALNTWHLQVSAYARADLDGGGAHAFFSAAKSRAFLFTGAADATMLRNEGWQWLTVGRHLERVSFTCRVLGSRAALVSSATATRTTPAETYGWTVLLRALSSYEAYRGTHRSGIDPRRVTAFLLLDPDSPRSALYSARHLESALHVATEDTIGEDARRQAGRLRADLEYRKLDELLGEGLETVLRRVDEGCASLHTALAATSFARGVPAELRTIGRAS